MTETLSLTCASAGLGVGGDAVAALRVDLRDGRASSHVWVYHLWGPAWSLRPEQHQGVFVCLENESILRVPPVHLHLCVFQSMVQVETLGELGVFFTFFVVGLEFSPERLRKVNIIVIL